MINNYIKKKVNKKLTFKKRLEKYAAACFSVYVIPYIGIIFSGIFLTLYFISKNDSARIFMDSFVKSTSGDLFLMSNIIALLVITYIAYSIKEGHKKRLIEIFNEVKQK